MRFNHRVVRAIDSPISSAYAATEQLTDAQDLLDLAQAAPQYPPAPEVVEHVARVARDERGGTYTDVPGLPQLREAFAAELTRDYGGVVKPANVVVTAGCNQAFSLVAAAVASPGDEVIMPLPYYFNHDMWLRMNGVTPVYLEPGPDLLPHAATAEALITPRTSAIALVTPGNPSGATVSPAGVAAFAEVARRHDIALILDETYRSFRGTGEPAHHLFADPEWARTVVSLHSFSKDLAIPGYRVGAVVASRQLNQQVCKLLDCIAICAPRIGQEAAWAGLTRRRLARRAGPGGRPAAGVVRRGHGRTAGRIRAAGQRRVLRLDPPPVHRSAHRGRSAGTDPRTPHAGHAGHGVQPRRPRHAASQRQQHRSGGHRDLHRTAVAGRRWNQ